VISVQPLQALLIGTDTPDKNVNMSTKRWYLDKDFSLILLPWEHNEFVNTERTLALPVLIELSAIRDENGHYLLLVSSY